MYRHLFLAAIITVALLTPMAADARMWTDTTGKFTVEAEFVKLEDDVVHLRKPDGEVIEVPLKKLILADRRFAERANDPEAAQAAAEKRQAEAERRREAAAERRANKAPKIVTGEKAIRKALAKKISVDFDETPLEEALDYLRDMTQILIIADINSLDDLGLKIEDPVTLSKKNTQTKDILKQIGEQLNEAVTWTIRHEVLMITSNESEEENLDVIVYQITRKVEVDALEEDLETKILPDAWEDVGGYARKAALNQILVIGHKRDAHNLIQTQYRQTLRPVAKVQKLAAPAGKKSARNLNAKTVVHADETPLDELTEQLASKHRLKFEFDKESLEEIGLAPDTPVTLSVSGISVGSALSLICMRVDFDLRWVSRDGKILITTRETAEYQLVPHVYPVDRLVANDDLEALADLVSIVIEPASWEPTGGPGTIAVGEKPGTLAIKQTVAIHTQIASLLSGIEKAGR